MKYLYSGNQQFLGGWAAELTSWGVILGDKVDIYEPERVKPKINV